MRTSVAIVVFGFAIGRFAIALRQLTEFQRPSLRTAEVSVGMGMSSMVAGVVMVATGLLCHRRMRVELDAGTFEAAGFVLDLVTI